MLRFWQLLSGITVRMAGLLSSSPKVHAEHEPQTGPFLHRSEGLPSVRAILASFLLSAGSCTGAVLWLDHPVARAVAKVIRPQSFAPNMPDLLMPMVVAVSLAALVLWLAARSMGHARLAHLAVLVGISGPLALGLKFFAKWLFGRGQVKYFLRHPATQQFHWLHGHGPWLSFPSGHMVVATAWVVVVATVFPRLRLWGWCALVLLALALLLGSYHFVGDLIAGTFLGACVGWFTIAISARRPSGEALQRPNEAGRESH